MLRRSCLGRPSGQVSVGPQRGSPIVNEQCAMATHLKAGKSGTSRISRSPPFCRPTNTCCWSSASYGLATDRVGPLVGDVFAHNDPRYLDAAAQNGLLDRWMWSVSTPTAGPCRWNRSWRTIAWLQRHGRPSNRCGSRNAADRGSAVRNGSARRRRLGALDITMKGVGPACGIARYFPFVYPYYEERISNFGMMDRRGSPLRSMAAYAPGRRLGRKELWATCRWRCSRQPARVFGDGQDTVVILHRQASAPGAVRLPLPARRAEGIDGRGLEIARGLAPVPDGLTYVWIDAQQLSEHLTSDTPAMRLSGMARQAPAQRPEPSPVVMRFAFDSAAMEGRSEGYALKGEKTPAQVPVRLVVFNLGKQVQELTFRLALPDEARWSKANRRNVFASRRNPRPKSAGLRI